MCFFCVCSSFVCDMSEIEDAFCLRFATDMPPLTQSDVSQFDHHADKPKGPDLFIKVLLRFSFYILQLTNPN